MLDLFTVFLIDLHNTEFLNQSIINSLYRNQYSIKPITCPFQKGLIGIKLTPVILCLSQDKDDSVPS